MANPELRNQAIATIKGLSNQEIEAKIVRRGIDYQRTPILDKAIECYERKYPLVKEELLAIAIVKHAQAPQLFPNIHVDLEPALMEQRDRMLDKLALCLKEKELRTDKKVSRKYHGTVYYIDFVNGTDGGAGTVHDGLMEDNGGAYYTALGATDATKIEVNTLTLDNNIDDDYNGDYLYNVTRGLGAQITDYDADDLGAEPACVITVAIAGQTAGDEFYIIRAFLTWDEYSTVRLRAAGDIAWVRANMTYIPGGSIQADEDGDVDNLIEVRGCSAAGGEDPWVDADNTKPLIDFAVNARTITLSLDAYWRIYRIDATGSTTYAIYFSSSAGTLVDACDIHDNSTVGIHIAYNSPSEILNCNFYRNVDYSIKVLGETFVNNCVFNGGGGVSTNYAIRLETGGIVWVKDSTFGVTTQHDNASFSFYYECGYAICRNCKFDDAADVNLSTGNLSYLLSEDHDQVKGAQMVYLQNGTIERDGVIQIDALDSAKITPDVKCGLYNPIRLSRSRLSGAYRIWLPAALATVTIKARETVAWVADPTATEFYFEASYLSNAVTAVRSTQASAQVLNGINVVNFTMTFTPLQAGWVYIQCYLKHFEAGKMVNISLLPVVS